jgi:hypothetical protein
LKIGQKRFAIETFVTKQAWKKLQLKSKEDVNVNVLGGKMMLEREPTEL